MTVLQEKLARLDIIVLLTVPAVNALLAKKMKLKILVRALPVRQQRAAPMAAQVTQLPQAAARPYAQSVNLRRFVLTL